MAWTETARRYYARDLLRYASDMTDKGWALIEPLMPPANRIGRPREVDLREIVNAILISRLQAARLGISRSNVYYQPRPVSPADLVLMRRIDELHLDYTSGIGYLFMRACVTS